MSASIILLCEDVQTDSFVRRFLRHRKFRSRDIHTLPLPAGSGEQRVRESYPRQLKAVRSRKKAILLVVTDADNHTTADRRSQLDQECEKNGIPRTEPNDPVMIIVPRRNIETWFAYLRGEEVDETSRYPKFDHESECHPLADALHVMCHEKQQLDPSTPESLREACREYPKISVFLRR